jgi:hypothetical protein
VNHQQAEEGLRDGLAKATKFCDKATDTRTVMHNGFSRKYTSLKESSEDRNQSITGRVLVSVVRSHSHDSSFMHSDFLPFYTYTVAAELYFI